MAAATFGPNPGVYGRGPSGRVSRSATVFGQLGSVCVTALEVEIQADFDARGELAVSDTVRPGYLAMRYVVTVESSAASEDILRVLDAADRCSSWPTTSRMVCPSPEKSACSHRSGSVWMRGYSAESSGTGGTKRRVLRAVLARAARAGTGSGAGAGEFGAG